MSDRHTHPFSPFVDKNSKVLILGTFPSIKSFEENFYYAHPRNQFWGLLAGVFDEETPKSLKDKKEFLKRHGIALWDVVQSCKRKNSLDSNLKDIKPNDIRAFLKEYPKIKKIYFTSKTALKLYERYFKDVDVEYGYLDSPSPAYAKKSFKKKLESWKRVLKGKNA